MDTETKRAIHGWSCVFWLLVAMGAGLAAASASERLKAAGKAKSK